MSSWTMPPYDGPWPPEDREEREPQQPPELTDELVDAMPWLIGSVEVS